MHNTYYILNFHVDGWLEDSWCAASSSNIYDGKSWVDHEPRSLQINPAYGVSPRITENAEETEATAYVYVNDSKQSTVIAEEYENLNLSPSSAAQSLSPKKQSQNINESELSNEYEIHYF